MNNIQQVTNFSDIVKSASTQDVSIYVGNKEYITASYYILPASALTGSTNIPIIKFIAVQDKTK